MSSLSSNFSNSNTPALAAPPNTPALPWRRANVRHTSNELYADIVETLSVTLAPSGRPLAAFANGSIAFTAKVSGVPDVTLNLGSASGKHNVGGIMELPVFHPCVRLNRWKERPGELSFIPPDGRFILAGYEVDLLPFAGGGKGADSLGASNLRLPVNLEMRTGLGPAGSEFEVRLQVNKASSASGQFARGIGSGRTGSPGAPLLEQLTVTIPLPEDVRNLSDMRPSRGDASFSPGERVLEWHVPSKELSGPVSHFGLRCTVAGSVGDDEEDRFDPSGFAFSNDYSYSEPYQSSPAEGNPTRTDGGGGGGSSSNNNSNNNSSGNGSGSEQDAKRAAQNKILMPTSASVSFSVKGWLASGLKVDSIVMDARKSRGLGEGVKPYKGVKYLTVSKGGVEIRC
ncbi:hypothetical protein UVI_02059780 [Ustilaginoidea virens]|uniref:MHD domain-containing protein n=1 Tax=Ustilaginoidea virens TaxID=1159556 RepID=A0A1B5L3L2_USTVR|nr:hypothetical protein UVI_02059780 [Ustilaginoidea virens]